MNVQMKQIQMESKSFSSVFLLIRRTFNCKEISKKYLAIHIFNCRYWCSTKVDDDLEHIAGQGNWGFCRQSCPPITLVTTTLRPTTITASKISEAVSIGDYTFYLLYL
jgi:hypothetical protein